MDRRIAPEPDHKIIVKVFGPDGSCMQIKIKMLAPLGKLMSVYCGKTGLNLESLRFRFDGDVINESDTPYSMDLSDGDIIQVFQSMDGGSMFLDL